MADQTPPTPEERIAALIDEMTTLREEVADLTGPDAAANAIVPLSHGGADIDRAEIVKEQVAQVRAEAKRKQLRLRALSEEIQKELEAQRRAVDALMRPLQEQIAVLEEQSWTIDLYLGVQEEIVLLAEGDPAPASTPLTLRQEVLSMDEETAAFAADGGIDYQNLDVFDEWIREPENLARVLPEPKGVVVLVPRMRGKDYGDPWASAEKNKENRWSYFLIRNGERLWRMRTDFVVGQHLIPRTDEFTGLFVGTRYNHETGRRETYQLLPGTHEWKRAADAQDARQRHYMRMALILQGLVNRTTVWHPLPEGGINLLDMRTYDEGVAHLVMDAENVLPDTAEPFYDWLARLNNNLRVGMRIIGDFHTKAFKEAGDEWTDTYGNGRSTYHANNRITPRAREAYYADKPESRVLHRLDARMGNGFAFKFTRTTKRWIKNEWGREELRAPKTKGTCVVYPTDRFILPFDLVTVAEMEHYLGSRTHRSAYAHMFPLLHAAIAAKKAEAAEEQPFRDRLAAALVDADPVLGHAVANDPDLTAAHEALDPLVAWWKLGNKHHRALTGDPDAEEKALRAIVAEHLARTRDSGRAAKTSEQDAEAATVERLLALDPKPIVIVRKRDGGYLAFAPQPRSYGPRVGAQNLWLTEYTTTKTARTIKTREWVTAGNRADALRTLYVNEKRWSTWDKFTAPTEDLTDPEIAVLTDGLVDQVVEEVRAGFEEHGWWNGPRAQDPVDVLPLGLVLDRSGKKFEVWMTEAFAPAALDSAPRADTGERGSMSLPFNEYHVDIAWTKTAKDGASLAPREDWRLGTHRGGSYSSGGSSARPWGYFWDGKERGPAEIETFAKGQDYATERSARIEAYRDAERALHKPTETALHVVGRGVRAVKERVAYEEFLAEYRDPDLWEGHKKTLRYGTFDTHFAAGRYHRGVPETLVKALDMLTDAGISHEGLTVRTAVEKAGLDPAAAEADFAEQWNGKPIPSAQFMDLPVWEDPEPDTEPDAENDDRGNEDEAADDATAISDGPEGHDAFDEDGIVILSGADVLVGGVLDPDEDHDGGDGENLPAVLAEESKSHAGEGQG